MKFINEMRNLLDLQDLYKDCKNIKTETEISLSTMCENVINKKLC